MAIGLLALLIIDAILFVASALLMPRPKIKGVSPNFPDRPTSKEGVPVPVVWGTILIPANVTHFSDVTAVEQTEKVQTGLFSSHKVTVGYSYSAVMQCILCYGVINELIDIIWQDVLGLNDTNIVTIQENDGSGHYHLREVTQDYVDPPLPQTTIAADGGTEFGIFAKELFGGYKHGGGVQGIMRLFWGLPTQTADLTLKALTTPVPGSPEYPAYQGVAHVVFGRKTAGPIEPFNFGEFSTIPPVAFLVRRTPSNLGLSGAVTNINGGANPAECIYEALTNTVWGACQPTSEIETSTFIACANTLAAELFGLHLSLNQEESTDDVITELLRHVDGQVQQNPLTGKIEMSLNRADYTPATLLLLDDTNSEIEISRPAWTNMVNQVKVTYTAQRGTKFTTIPTQPVDDIASQRDLGVVHSMTIPFPGVRDAFLANQLAVRELRKGATPLQRATVKTNRIAAGLKVGSPFKITNAASGVNDHVFRVVSINFGSRLEGEIKIEAIEDVFNLDSPFYNTPIDAPAAWTGVGPVGAVRVAATATSDETTGYLTLVITGGNGLATAVQFREQSGTAAITAWHDNITSGSFATQVDLDEKHPSLIGWRVLGHLKDGSTGSLAEGEANYPIATRPARPGVTYTLDPDGTVDLIIDVDQDAVAYRYLVLYDHVPTVAEVHAEASHAIPGPDRRIIVPNVATLDSAHPVAYAGVLALDAVGAESPIGTTSMGDTGSNGSSSLAMRLHRSHADDSIVEIDAYVSDTLANVDFPIVVQASDQGIGAIVAEDGTKSTVLTTRGNYVQSPKNGTVAPWYGTLVPYATTTFEATEVAPDGSLGVTKLEVKPAFPGYAYIGQVLGTGDFNGVEFSAEVWLRTHDVSSSRVYFLIRDQAAAGAGPGLTAIYAPGTVDDVWRRYTITGTVDHAITSLELVIIVETPVGSTLLVWSPAVVRGDLGVVTNDLETTDFVSFKVTRPERQSTAKNLLLQSNHLGTAPWVPAGTGTVTENAATFNGISFTEISQPTNALNLTQQLSLENTGVHSVGVLLHRKPGNAGTVIFGIHDGTLVVNKVFISATIDVDGVIHSPTVSIGPANSVISLEAEDDDTYRLWFRTPELDKTHTLYIYAAVSGGGASCHAYYVSQYMIKEGDGSFPEGIETTTAPASLTIDNPSGLITLTARRLGGGATAQSIIIEPKGAIGNPVPLITIEGEGTARGGNGQGQVRLLINFDEKTNQIDVYGSESPTSGGAAPVIDDTGKCYSVVRQEGVIASDDKWKTEIDISTHKDWYRQLSAWIYGGFSLAKTSRVPPIKFFEQVATDTGTGPSAAPSAVAVSFTTVNGKPRATISFTAGDGTASHRVFRNKTMLIRLAPGVVSVVDDELIPGKVYAYDVQAVKNGQTSEFASGPAGGGSGGTSGTPTLSTPSFAPGYPSSGGYIFGADPYVNIRAVNPNPGSDTHVFMSPSTTDTGTFAEVGFIPDGSTDVTIHAADVGVVNGDLRYFYLIATKSGYTNSAQSTHLSGQFFSDGP